MIKRHKMSAGNIPEARWLAYATAGAMTALASAPSAEAAIHYSGTIDATFPLRGFTLRTYPLDQPGDYIKLGRSTGILYDFFNITGQVSFAFRETGSHNSNVSRLPYGDSIPEGSFSQGFAGGFGNLIGPLAPNNWKQPGIGFIGFRFDGGNGVQYGWVRIRMANASKHNDFKLVDYAYADPGETITAGQTKTSVAATDKASLGLLALGAVGVAALRRAQRVTVVMPARQ